ncbi:hypothetical protein BDQ17DRAFT_154162 [Cyathus striatus]|nr:hypothetical protein BDQ17DRAFT_154162 [Cyathus striatus]
MFRFISLLSFIFIIILSITPYGDVEEAMKDTAKVKPLVKRFSAQRATCLMIISALLAIYVRQDRATSASLALGAILFTNRICLTYDGVNEDIFKGIGPPSYTVIMMLPGIISQAMLLYEIFAMSSSIILAILIASGCYALVLISIIAAMMMTQNEVNEGV